MNVPSEQLKLLLGGLMLENLVLRDENTELKKTLRNFYMREGDAARETDTQSSSTASPQESSDTKQ